MDDFQYDYSDYYEFRKQQANKPSLVDERNHPNHWFNRAADLHASARVLWLAMNGALNDKVSGAEQSQGFSYAVACNPVYYMLCGLSLELVIKALLVQNGIARRCCINHPEADLPQTSDGFTQQRPSGVCPER